MTGTLLALTAASQGGAICLLLLSAALLFRERARPAACYGAAFALSAAFAVLSDGDTFRLVAWLRVAADVLAILATPLFWLMARAWFEDSFRLRLPSIAALSAYVALCCIATFAPLSAVGGDILEATTYVAGVVMAANALWIAWSGREADLVEVRRSLRFRFIVSAGLVVIWSLSTSSIVRLGPSRLPLALADAVVISIVTLTMSIAILGIRDRNMLPSPKAVGSQGSSPPSIDQRLLTSLQLLMTRDRLYRDPRLTIGALAVRLGAPDYKLRKLINDGLGYRNFNDYLNTQRLAEVRATLEDSTQDEVSILTVAMDAGFGSLAAFNRAFKAATGETPSEYRRRAALGDRSNSNSDQSDFRLDEPN